MPSAPVKTAPVKTAAQLEREILESVDPLAIYLRGRGLVPGIGAERGREVRDGVARLSSSHGSTRYVMFSRGEPVAALQVVSADGSRATIANAYTVGRHRRRGFAAALLRRAREDFDEVVHAADAHLSADGRAWRDRVEGVGRRR